MPTDTIDYYELLGVPRTATRDEIKRAFRALSLKYHPDTNADANAAALFRLISEAYQTLSDDTMRAAYDRGPTPASGYSGYEPPGYGSGATDNGRDHDGQSYSQSYTYDEPYVAKPYRKTGPIGTVLKFFVKVILGILLILVTFVSKVLLLLGALATLAGWGLFGLGVLIGIFAVFDASYGILPGAGIIAFIGFVIAYAAIPFLALLELIKEFLHDKVFYW